MRFMILAALSLLGGCVTETPDIRIPTWDLTLGAPAGRAALRQRVTAASRQLSARHCEEVMPIEMRENPNYCLDLMRSDILSSMTREVRRAYWLSLREAGVTGRGL